MAAVSAACALVTCLSAAPLDGTRALTYDSMRRVAALTEDVASATFDPLAAMSKRWELPRSVSSASCERNVASTSPALTFVIFASCACDPDRHGRLRVFVRGGPLERHQRERDGEGDREHEAAQQQRSDPRDDGEPE